MRPAIMLSCVVVFTLGNVEMGLEAKFRGLNVITQCVIPGMVALTYDDGVSPYTEELLNVLEAEQVRASFFILGRSIATNKTLAHSMLKRMWASGHVIGSHTYNHANLTALSDTAIMDEMKATEVLIDEAIGVKPALMRPPFGEIEKRTEDILESLGYTVVIWNVDSDDWRLQSTSVSNITSHVKSMFPNRANWPSKSYIILDHDTLHPSVAAQKEIIYNLKAKGYVFGNLSECLGGAAVYRDK